MPVHISPSLFSGTSFPPNKIFNKIETHFPESEIIEEGTKIDFENPDTIIPDTFFTDYVVGPILALFTPIILLAILVHFIVVNLLYDTGFKTYFAHNFVLGINMMDGEKAEKYRVLLEGLTPLDQETLRAIDKIAKNMITEVQDQVIESCNGLTHEQIKTISLAHDIQTNINNSVTLDFEEIAIEGTQSKLDGFCVRSYGMSLKPSNEQRWIIYYPGRQTTWEMSHKSIIRLAQLTGLNVLTFNYRGVVRSGREDLNDPDSKQETTNTVEMLAEDAQSAVDHLLDQEVEKDHILNYGHSLGGGVASTLTDMAICSDRSFRSTGKVLENLFWIPVLRHVLKWVSYYTFGEVDAFKNIQEIQENGKDTFICTSPRDIVIDLRSASLHSAFQDKLPEKTPRTMLLHYSKRSGFIYDRFNSTRSGSNRNRLNERVYAHTADIPDNVVNLIMPWLDKE